MTAGSTRIISERRCGHLTQHGATMSFQRSLLGPAAVGAAGAGHLGAAGSHVDNAWWESFGGAGAKPAPRNVTRTSIPERGHYRWGQACSASLSAPGRRYDL